MPCCAACVCLLQAGSLQADELPVRIAVDRATAVSIRGWGPTTPPQIGLASYGFGQVVNTPGIVVQSVTMDGMVAEGLIVDSSVTGSPSAPIVFQATTASTPNFVSIELPPSSQQEGRFRNLEDVVATVGIACGEFHTLLLKRDGTVVGRGWDGLGQATVPPGLTNVVAIACGLDHSIAILADGRAAGWGRNDQRQAEVDEAENHGFIAAAGGLLHTALLRSNGTVHVTHPQLAPEASGLGPIEDAVAVAAGASHTVVLRRDGRVMAFGRGAGVLDPVPDKAEGAIAIAAGGYFSLALRPDGRVVAWGDGRYGQTKVPDAATNVIAIAAGSFHAVALRADGSVLAWGEGSNGALNVPAGLSGVMAVAAGGYHTQVLVRPGPALSAPRRTDGRLMSDIFLGAGTRYAVDASPDLETWTEVHSDVAGPGSLQAQVPEGSSTGFIRLRPLAGVRGQVPAR